MNEEEFEQLLAGLLEEASVEEDGSASDLRVQTFEENGVLTTNRGVVVRLTDGSEFQVTVLRSR